MIRLSTVCALAASFATVAGAQTVMSNVDPSGNFAWGENVGWINFRGEGTATDDALPPPTIGISGLSGYAWGENIGWINLGDGTNTDPNAHGVIVDSGTGVMSGYAWGENVGWLNFGTNYGVVPANQRPQINLGNGAMTGFVWGENIGWINLDGSSTGGATAQVRALPPTAPQVADGLAAITAVPLFSDQNTDGDVDAADIVTIVNP